MKTPQELLTLTRVARILDCSEQHVRNLFDRGVLGSGMRDSSGRRLILADELEKYREGEKVRRRQTAASSNAQTPAR